MTGQLLRRKINTFRAWYRLVRTLEMFQNTAFAGLTVMTLYVAGQKLIFFSGYEYTQFALLLSVACVLFLVVNYLFVRADPATVCYLIDQRAGLRNLVASGVCVMDQSDEVSDVVIRRAKDILHNQTPRSLMPPSINKAGRYLYIPALLLLACLLLPQSDLFGRREKYEKKQADELAVKEGALKLTAKLTSLEVNMENLQSIESQKILKDFDSLSTNLMGVARQEALEKLGEFENKYKQEFANERNFEKAIKAMETAPDMKGLSPESMKQMDELAKDLKDGKFGEAAKSLKELSEQLKGKDLSIDEKKALAREMAKMVEQMQGLQMSEEMSKLLREIASSTENIDDLLKQACDKAGDQLSELAKFCEQCDGLKAMKEGLQEAKQSMLGDSFQGFDAKEVEQYMEAEAQLGEGSGDGDGEGVSVGIEGGKGKGGTGGEGQGRGGLPLENQTDTAFKNEMSKSKINQGKILHQLFVTGVPEKGDSANEYSEVVHAAKQHAAGSLARDRIPREYEDMVKSYFDSLEVKEKKDAAAP